MPVISTLRTRASGELQPVFGTYLVKDVYKEEQLPPRHQAYVDSPEYLPIKWIDGCGGLDAVLANFTKQFRPLIVGAGWAGTRMGLEFAKCGIKVQLIEARDRCGGRMSAIKGKGQNEYHLGSMRYPPSEGMLFELAYHYGFAMLSGFINPGHSPTLLTFSNTVQYWNDPSNIPEGFETVFNGWNAMLKHGFEIDGEKFASFVEITDLLRSTDIETRKQARPCWQKYIDHFKNKTLKEMMIEIFIDNPKPPGCVPWTLYDLNELWGKGGIGSGGFGVFFSLCALSIMRIPPNEWEVDQCTFVEQVDGEWKPTSAEKLVDAIFKKAENFGLEARFETELMNIRKSADCDGNQIYIVTVKDKHRTYDIECDLPILAIPPKVIVELGLARKDLFPDHICEALQNVHMVQTTKVFVSLLREHFADPATARVILGDLFQTYIMDFKDPEHLAGLLDYAWAEHSQRYRSETDPQKCADMIKEEITKALKGSKYEKWLDCLETVEEAFTIHWQHFKYARGAFTLLKPDQDKYCSDLFHYSGEDGPCVTTASATPYDGWIEGAEIKMHYDFAHIGKRYGTVVREDLSPVECMKPFKY